MRTPRFTANRAARRSEQDRQGDPHPPDPLQGLYLSRAVNVHVNVPDEQIPDACGACYAGGVRGLSHAFLGLLAAGCWFPGNPTGRSSNDETPPCTHGFPNGRPCGAGARVCRDRNEHYECFEGRWHVR